MRALRIITALGLSLFALALGGCGDRFGSGSDTKEDSADAGVAEVSIPVEVAAAKKGDITKAILSTSNVTARYEVVILSETQGSAKVVAVEEGDRVEKGDLLARLVNPELELSVPIAASSVSRLRREVKNLEPLLAKGYVSRQSYEELKHQLTQAVDQLKRARTQVDDLRIRSPLSGVVGRRSVVKGQQVSPGQELFYVVDPSALEVVINIPERSLGRISESKPAYVESEALGDARFEGKIRLINPVVNPQTGTIKVTVTLDNVEAKPSRLRPGMFVSVFLITDKRKGATLIPKRGVVYKDDKSFVFVAQGEGQDRVAERRPIEVGFSEEENVEVIAGLETGDEIVVLGQSGLKDGAEIRIVK